MKIKLKQTLEKLISLDKAMMKDLMSTGNFDREAIKNLASQINDLQIKVILLDTFPDQQARDLIADLEEEISLCEKIIIKKGLPIKKDVA